MAEALALLELDGVACGLAVLDSLVKRAPVQVLEANLVEPGKYLLLYTGGVAEVGEAREAALERAVGALLDDLFLPMVHASIVPALRGVEHRPAAPDTLGVIEGKTVAATLQACDRALKDAFVGLCGLRVVGGLGGRAYFVVEGAQHDVESALAVAEASLGERRHRTERIARPHGEMVAWLLRGAPFGLQ